MNHVTAVADSIPTLEKTMLTCFVCNDHARCFYENLGFGMDESSPQRKKLRGGRVIEPEYIIMARQTRRNSEGQAGDLQGNMQQPLKRPKNLTG